jgi:hypothetical protein
MIEGTNAPRSRVSLAAIWAGWIIGAAPSALLLISAVFCFGHSRDVVKRMEGFGYSEHIIATIGVVELVCTLIYLFPPTAVLGAVLLTGYLGGATATHVRIGDPSYVTPITCGVLLWLGLFLRDARIRALLPLRTRMERTMR